MNAGGRREARRAWARIRAWCGASSGDERVREQLLTAARLWLADTVQQQGGEGAGQEGVLGEVERTYPGGVRQLALDTFTDALTSTPIEQLVPDAFVTVRGSRGHQGEQQ